MINMKRIKKLIALLLVMVFTLSLVPTTAKAETVDPEDATYELELGPTGDNYNYHYSSATSFLYTIIKGGVPYSTYHYAYIFNLRDMVNDGRDILAYCTDIDVVAEQGHKYRRLNLEDSPFSANSAGQIRAILTHGFYFTESKATTAEHEKMVLDRVAELAAAANVPNLHVNEALVATQLAIWKATHGSLLTYDVYVRDYIVSKVTMTKYASLCNYTQKPTPAAAAANVKAVYDYLLSLDPIGPGEKVVSPSSFTNLNEPTFTKNDDGTYDVTVNATVNVHMETGDSLTLEAKLGGKTASASLGNGSQSKSLIIKNVPAVSISNDVILSISGTQTAEGYYYFDSKGDRTASQNMVGYDRGRQSVYAQVVADHERVLEIQKTTTNGGNRFPLRGISFDIYKVATMEEYQSGEFVMKENPADDIPNVPYAEYTVITDEEGKATFNLTQHGLPDGIYLVVEHPHPSIVKPVDPFYVSVPMTNSRGTGFDYTVTVKPKNDIKGDVDIDKDVIFVGNNDASVNAALPHTWIISSTVPHDISTGTSYEITDTLDNRLDYIGNMKVTLETIDASAGAVELVAGTDYKATENDVDSTGDGKPSDSFKVELTKSGMSKIATQMGNKDSVNYRIRVYFDAQLNENAEIVTDIPNDATVEYKNTFDFTFRAESDKPVVRTGAVNLLKVDAKNKDRVLPGAVFEVYRAATKEEIEANNENLVNIDGVDGKVVKVPFYDNLDLEGEAVNSITTDKDGKATIAGLAYGEYYLVEAEAPSGYEKLANGSVIVIDQTSHLEDNMLVIENESNGVVLPTTGGMGTGVFTIGGIILLSISGLLFINNKRKTYKA